MSVNKPREMDGNQYMEEHLRKVLLSFGYKIDHLKRSVDEDKQGYQGVKYELVVFERFN